MRPTSGEIEGLRTALSRYCPIPVVIGLQTSREIAVRFFASKRSFFFRTGHAKSGRKFSIDGGRNARDKIVASAQRSREILTKRRPDIRLQKV